MNNQLYVKTIITKTLEEIFFISTYFKRSNSCTAEGLKLEQPVKNAIFIYFG